MEKLWSDKGWEQYLYWQKQDSKTLERINTLIKDIISNGVSRGIGKPEKLRYIDAWSRRIDDKNRLTYKVNEYGYLYIISCKGHYE